MVLNAEHIKRDLARQPPPPPTAATGASTKASLRGLALVVLHQQLAALAGMRPSSADDAGIKAERQRTQETLRASAAAVLETADEGDAADQAFRMAEAWEEALEKEEEDDDEDKAVRPSAKDRYLGILKERHVLPVRLPLSAASAPKGSDDTDHQSMRDIERDNLVVNNAAYQPGGLGGHTRVLLWLQEVLKGQLEAAGCPVGKLTTPAVLEAYIKQLLRQVNRTNSAGAAYDVLLARLGVEGVTTIVPDSKAAEPLSIQVDAGAFPVEEGGGEGWGWGLRARLQTATSYVCYDEAAEEEWVSVRAEYRETVCLPLVRGGGRPVHVSLGASVLLTQWTVQTS